MRALPVLVAPHIGPAAFHEQRELVGASATGVTRSLWALEKWGSPQQQMFAINLNMWWNLLSHPYSMLGGEGLGKHRWSRPGPRRGGSSTPWPSRVSQGPRPLSARHALCLPGACTRPAAGKAGSRPFRVGLSSLWASGALASQVEPLPAPIWG